MSKRQQHRAYRRNVFWGEKYRRAQHPEDQAQVLWDQLRAAIKSSPKPGQAEQWQRTAEALNQILQEVTDSEINM